LTIRRIIWEIAAIIARLFCNYCNYCDHALRLVAKWS